jgi:hypothetical protein
MWFTFIKTVITCLTVTAVYQMYSLSLGRLLCKQINPIHGRHKLASSRVKCNILTGAGHADKTISILKSNVCYHLPLHLTRCVYFWFREILIVNTDYFAKQR